MYLRVFSTFRPKQLFFSMEHRGKFGLEKGGLKSTDPDTLQYGSHLPVDETWPLRGELMWWEVFLK